LIAVQNFDIGGERMSEFIWHWTKDNKKIYTRRIDVAERAMKEAQDIAQGEEAMLQNLVNEYQPTVATTKPTTQPQTTEKKKSGLASIADNSGQLYTKYQQEILNLQE